MSAKKRERVREKEKKNHAVEEAKFGASKVVCNYFVKYRIEISKVVKCSLPFSSISVLILCVINIFVVNLCLVFVSLEE